MVKLDTVKEILDIEEKELEKLETEKLRDLFGVLHFASRLIEHEIDRRDDA